MQKDNFELQTLAASLVRTKAAELNTAIAAAQAQGLAVLVMTGESESRSQMQEHAIGVLITKTEVF